MQRLPGYRNEKELSLDEKLEILNIIYPEKRKNLMIL